MKTTHNMKPSEIKKQEQDAKFMEFDQFRKEHGRVEDGYEKIELANKAAVLQMNWWGNNLVFLGIDERNGRFFPMFNVFD
jgi:hypothetical protein